MFYMVCGMSHRNFIIRSCSLEGVDNESKITALQEMQNRSVQQFPPLGRLNLQAQMHRFQFSLAN